MWTLRNIDGKLCECYCGINWEYNKCHSKCHHQLSFDDKGNMKTISVRNTDYNPFIKKPVKPTYCKRKPTDHCYKNHCPYFAYCEHEE